MEIVWEWSSGLHAHRIQVRSRVITFLYIQKNMILDTFSIMEMT